VIVTVVWATAEVQDVVRVELPQDACIADAVRRSGLIAQYGLDPKTIGFARFGARVGAGAPVADGDRVDITRPLLADPKAARVRRARATADAAQSRPVGRRRDR
jgi:putative ubiquitin-RnfH superfamily antitoxin RatB of RatAB toxin-antitoxin module